MVFMKLFCTVMINLNCEVDMSTKALILSGGSGTRFWPKSTKDKPKQFLRIISDRTMIQETVSLV